MAEKDDPLKSAPSWEDRPRVRLHPPTLLLAAMVGGFVLRVFAKAPIPAPRVLGEGLGGAMIIAAVMIIVSAVSAFAAGDETLKPDTPSRQLFVHGPFRFSRNPIYLAMMLLGGGLAIATLNLWMVLTTALAGVLLHLFVIKPEERYLEDRFGGEYTAYKKSVRRWI